MDHAVAAGFVSPQTWPTAVQRNNKRAGSKNLRCFPTCSAGGHATAGFCGASVVVRVDSAAPVVAFAEFRTQTSLGEPHTLRVGEVLPAAAVLTRCKTRARPLNPWFSASSSPSAPGHFEFNAELKSWHYGWQSSRHTNNEQHCLCVYVFEVLPGPAGPPAPEALAGGDAEEQAAALADAQLRCVSVLPSPFFKLYSSRRRLSRGQPQSSSSSSSPSSPPATRAKRERPSPGAPGVRATRHRAAAEAARRSFATLSEDAGGSPPSDAVPSDAESPPAFEAPSLAGSAGTPDTPPPLLLETMDMDELWRFGADAGLALELAPLPEEEGVAPLPPLERSVDMMPMFMGGQQGDESEESESESEEEEEEDAGEDAPLLPADDGATDGARQSLLRAMQDSQQDWTSASGETTMLKSQLTSQMHAYSRKLAECRLECATLKRELRHRGPDCEAAPVPVMGAPVASDVDLEAGQVIPVAQAVTVSYPHPWQQPGAKPPAASPATMARRAALVLQWVVGVALVVALCTSLLAQQRAFLKQTEAFCAALPHAASAAVPGACSAADAAVCAAAAAGAGAAAAAALECAAQHGAELSAGCGALLFARASGASFADACGADAAVLCSAAGSQGDVELCLLEHARSVSQLCATHVCADRLELEDAHAAGLTLSALLYAVAVALVLTGGACLARPAGEWMKRRVKAVLRVHSS